MANRAINNRQKLTYRQKPALPSPLPAAKPEKGSRKGKRAKPLPPGGKPAQGSSAKGGEQARLAAEKRTCTREYSEHRRRADGLRSTLAELP